MFWVNRNRQFQYGIEYRDWDVLLDGIFIRLFVRLESLYSVLCLEVYQALVHIFTLFFPELKNKKQRQSHQIDAFYRCFMEQDTGLEPAAYCLGSSRSTG